MMGIEIRQTDLSQNLKYLKTILDKINYQRLVTTTDKSLFVVFEAWEGQECVGAIFVQHFFLFKNAILQCTCVKEGHQNKGIGSQLFDKMVAYLKEKDTVVFTANAPKCKFLASRFTISNEPVSKEFTFECKLFKPEWMERHIPLKKGFKIFSWNKLTKQELQFLDMQENTGQIPSSVAPVEEGVVPEMMNSYGLRYQSAIVSWIITHRVAEDTIKYAALYIRSEFRHTRLGIALLQKAIKRQQASPIKWSVFTLYYEDVDKSWLKFVEKRIAPYAQKAEDIYYYELLLK